MYILLYKNKIISRLLDILKQNIQNLKIINIDYSVAFNYLVVYLEYFILLYLKAVFMYHNLTNFL